MTTAQFKSNIILLDYYDGANGPTFRIDVMAPERLEQLKSTFVDLRDGTRQQVDLLRFERLKIPSKIKQVILSLDLSKGRIRNSLHVMKSGDGFSFEWSGNSGHWDICAGLIDGLLISESPGHLYLSNEAIDDAIIELTFSPVHESDLNYRVVNCFIRKI